MPAVSRSARLKDRLFHDIVDRIQEMIVSGKLKPGDQLPSERQLAEEYGVSRTAVREAIRSLAEKGLVEVLLGRGTFVTTPTADHLAESITLMLQVERGTNADVLAARELLEVPIAGLAATRRTDENLQTLSDLLEDMKSYAGSPHEFNKADTEFHWELARATGNPVLAVLIQLVVAQILESAAEMWRYHNEHSIAIGLHADILERVRAQDVEGTKAAMKRHLDHVREVFTALGLR